MRPLKTMVLAFACIMALAAMGAAFSASSETSPPLRNFEFTYLARIPALPADAKTSRIWIPLPQSDRYQTIANLKNRSSFRTLGFTFSTQDTSRLIPKQMRLRRW